MDSSRPSGSSHGGLKPLTAAQLQALLDGSSSTANRFSQATGQAASSTVRKTPSPDPDIFNYVESSTLSNDALDSSTSEDAPTSYNNAHRQIPEKLKGKATEPAASTKSVKKTSAVDINSTAAFPALGGSKGARQLSGWGGASPMSSTVNGPGVGAGANSSTLQNPVTIPAPAALRQITVTLPSEKQEVRQKHFGNQKAPSLAETVRQIMSETNTKIESTTKMNGNQVFLVTGKETDQQKAIHAIFEKLSVKESITMSVPSSAIPFIIGQKGRKLKDIQDSTRAKIDLPKKTAASSGEGEEAVDETVVITITGHTAANDAACRAIEEIVLERASKSISAIPTDQIPANFYPLIAGPNDQHIAKIEAETGVTRISIPKHTHIPIHLQDAHGEGHSVEKRILIQGTPQHIQVAVDRLLQIYQDLKRSTRTLQAQYPKRQHRFLVGSKGSVLQEIMDKTGCSVELPPLGDSSEQVTIRGPAQQIMKAYEIIEAKASAANIDIVDLSTTHPAQPDLQRYTLRYLLKTGHLKTLGEKHSVQINPSRQAAADKFDPVIEIVGKSDSDVQAARKELQAIASSLQSETTSVIQIDSLLHKHIVGKKGANLIRIKNTYKVECIVPPEEDDDPDIFLVYIGASPDGAEESLRQARTDVEKLASDAADLHTEYLQIPVKYHSRLIGPNGTTLRAIISEPALVRVDIGLKAISRNGKLSNGALRASGQALGEETVKVRGPKDEVMRVSERLRQEMTDAQEYDLEHSYTAELMIKSAHLGHVVGKSGSNIRKLKDDLGVRVDIEEPQESNKTSTEAKVTISGIKTNVEEAKSRLGEFVAKLADETSIKLSVPERWHSAVIGTGGRYVKRLEEKYLVRIVFPRHRSNPDSSSHGNGEQENLLSPDEILVRGGKRGVEAARVEIQDLVKYEEEHGQTSTLMVPTAALARIVGKQGAQVNEIRDASETRIDIDRNADKSVQATAITISGTKAGINSAKKLIQEIVADFSAQSSTTIDIKAHLHRDLKGPGGKRIAELITRCGGPADISEQTGIVNLPRPGSGKTDIVIKGESAFVDRLKVELLSAADDLDRRTVIGLAIPASEHGGIIGRGGSGLHELESRYDASIHFPGSSFYSSLKISNGDQLAANPSSDIVKISSDPKNIEEIKNALLSRLRQSVTVPVPRNMHHVISNNGQLFRALRNHHGVSVDHAGQVPPIKSEQAKPTARIDDDQTYPWSVTELAGTEQGMIPWVLRGSGDQLEAAEKAIKKVLKEAGLNTHHGILTVPRSKHRLVVGRGGVSASKIRSESGITRLDVPQASSSSEDIHVYGSLENVERARQIITELVS